MGTYKFSKTFWKGVTILVEVGIAGLVVYFTDNNYYMALVPVLEMIRNAWKHYRD